MFLFRSFSSVLAISVDLGTTSSTGNIVWAIGVPRDPVIQIVDADSNTEDRRPYYMSMSSFHNASDAVSETSHHTTCLEKY